MFSLCPIYDFVITDSETGRQAVPLPAEELSPGSSQMSGGQLQRNKAISVLAMEIGRCQILKTEVRRQWDLAIEDDGFKYDHGFGDNGDATVKRPWSQKWEVSILGRKNKFYKIWIRKGLMKDGRTDECKFLVDNKRYSVYMYTHTYICYEDTGDI